MHIQGNGQVLGMPNDTWKEYDTFKSFYLFAGLVPLANYKLDNKFPAKGRVRIKKRFNVIDWLISGLSLGILYTETITVYAE